MAKRVIKYGTLFSSDGEIVFRVSDGKVNKSRSGWVYDQMPTRVDVDEWRKKYPGEDVDAGHDVLDFGLWFDETYYPPDPGFRKEWKKECSKEK